MMKHFIVDIIFIAPFEQIEPIVPEHRNFLQTGYDKGLLLASGPKVPRSGGIVIARAESRQVIKDYFANDPYRTNNVAEYTFTEFNPVKHSDVLNDWII